MPREDTPYKIGPISGWRGPQYVSVGPLHISWGYDLLNDEQDFYGVALRRTNSCWTFFGLVIDQPKGQK